jgi:predicted O-methyltransferase YrrM
VLKEHGASAVENIALGKIAGLEAEHLTTIGASADRLILTGIVKQLAPRTVFEIGTYLGETTLALARSCPQAQLYTLDLPDPETRKDTALEFTDEYLFERWDRGVAFRDQPEAQRIQCLQGDSARFDFSPYESRMDLIFIDASHSYSYVKADTQAALKMLSPDGAILWHDYPTYPGIFAYLNELAREQHLRIVHPLGSGLALYTRRAAELLLP